MLTALHCRTVLHLFVLGYVGVIYIVTKVALFLQYSYLVLRQLRQRCVAYAATGGHISSDVITRYA
jgi:hypothetical protein